MEKLSIPLATELKALVEPDIAEIRGWDTDKINAAKQAGIKMQIEENQILAAEEFVKVFEEADADKDGLLDIEEWKAFTRKYSELKASRNEPETTQSDDIRSKWWYVMN